MNPTAQLLEPEVRELIEEGRYSELRQILHELPSADVADIFTELDPKTAALGFRFLHRDDAGEVFSYLNAEKQEELIHELPADQTLRVVEAMSHDDRAALLDELPPEVAQRIMGSLSPESRKVTQAILGYPPESVGRLMTTDFVAVRPEWTIDQVLEHVRTHGRDAETINVLYVIDERGTLIDDVRLRQVLLADRGATVESIMNRQFMALRADQDQEEAVRLMSRYRRIALPVVDSRGALVGIVTVDDVTDVAQAEVTEDIQQQGGVVALEQPYMKAGFIEMFKKRGFWLAALFVGQSVTVLILGSFQKQLEVVKALTVFIPLVMSCGGNSGGQAATLLCRAIALHEISPKDWWIIVKKEIATGLALGSVLGVLGVCSVLFWWMVGVAKTENPAALAFLIGTAVVGVVIWGTMVGSLLPLVMRRLRLDPAAASSPMVATLMDASGSLIFFIVAMAVIRAFGL